MSDPAPKRTEKLQIMLDEDEMKAIDDWRFENRLPSRAAAIRELIRRGLNATEFPEPEAAAASREFGVLDGPGDIETPDDETGAAR
ncbi:MAG: hypothetical protein ACU85V_06480 [Gammaproteobacteria bacterium]